MPAAQGEVLGGSPELIEQAKRGEPLTAGGVLDVYAMPHESEGESCDVQVDVVLLTISVNRQAAEARKDELISILNDYPQPSRLAAGPSYIEVGAALGDQGAAFQLFALGQVLGLWEVLTPTRLGIADEGRARRMAAQGFVMITGYSVASAPSSERQVS